MTASLYQGPGAGDDCEANDKEEEVKFVVQGYSKVLGRENRR